MLSIYHNNLGSLILKLIEREMQQILEAGLQGKACRLLFEFLLSNFRRSCCAFLRRANSVMSAQVLIFSVSRRSTDLSVTIKSKIGQLVS